MFQLDERFKNLLSIGELPGSLAFLFPDSDNPWCVLIPPVENVREIHQLNEERQVLLLKDITRVSQFMEKEFLPTKINVGVLGNIVPQLHVHIICRFENDRAWPGPIWGTQTKEDGKILSDRLSVFKKNLLF